MLAPSCEALTGPLGALARHSLSLYPRFVASLTALAPDVDVGYISLPDFLHPHFSSTDLPTYPDATLLSAQQALLLEPTLSPSVRAAHRFSGQAHVNSRAVMAALEGAVARLGAEVVDTAQVRRLVVAPGGVSLDGVVTDAGEIVRGGHYVLAAGAWSGALLPGLPVRPVKGQMVSLRPPAGEEEVGRLRHVLHGDDVYIVPKRGGAEFYVGATMEEGTFEAGNTAGGVASLLNAAMRLVPDFERYEVAESWAGFRPATPDLLPVLGMSELDNMSIATGYFRNGFLIAPAAAKIAAAVALGEVDSLSGDLKELSGQFSIRRFLGTDGTSLAREEEAGRQVSFQTNESKARNASVLQNPLERETKVPVVEEDATKVLMWRLNPDGSKEPIPPSEEYVEEKRQERQSVAHVKSVVPEPQHEEKLTAFSYSAHVENAEMVSAENDAYEDVMKHRNDDDWQEVMRKAMATNRSYGREKSSLDTDDMPLSISAQEVERFDAAFELGLEDFKAAEKTFDDNHPSTVATRAELLRISRGTPPPVETIKGEHNAVIESANSVKDSTTPQGYF